MVIHDGFDEWYMPEDYQGPNPALMLFGRMAEAGLADWIRPTALLLEQIDGVEYFLADWPDDDKPYAQLNHAIDLCDQNPDSAIHIFRDALCHLRVFSMHMYSELALGPWHPLYDKFRDYRKKWKGTVHPGEEPSPTPEEVSDWLQQQLRRSMKAV